MSARLVRLDTYALGVYPPPLYNIEFLWNQCLTVQSYGEKLFAKKLSHELYHKINVCKARVG
jgi:hypothetical protein